jgi:putative ABC transport system permease protein
LILVIAGINFVNLATARSAERAKEVGVRKVLGSNKKQLVLQFLAESLLISCVSIVIAVGIIQMSIGFFNSLAQKQLTFDIFDNPMISIALFLVTLCLGLLAGLYPAFYISSLQPVRVLKGKFQSSSRGSLLRNGLVVFQFTISLVLISGTLVVFDQLKFVSTKDLGFEKSNLITINYDGQGHEAEPIMNELRGIPGVESVGAGNTMPGGYFYGLQFRLPGSNEVFTPKGYNADDDFNSTLNVRVKEGRLFAREFNDSLSVVVNEAAVRAMGLTNPIGTILTHSEDPENPTPYTIVGVVEDFNFQSLHTEITPLIIMSTESQFDFFSFIGVRMSTDNAPETIAALERVWKETLPNEPFIYSFLDNHLNNLYQSEKASGQLLTVFTIVAIVIACVGLFGLAAYLANQRTKEIGVRKVLGASVTGIVTLLSKDFAKLVLIATLLGIPIAWYLTHQWLLSFAYRISLDGFTFALSGLIILVLTIATISYQAISAARVNPVNSLKEE